MLRFPFRLRGGGRGADDSAAGVYFGVSRAYVTEVRGEDVVREALDPDKVKVRVRRCRHVVGAVGGPAVAYKNAVMPPDLKGRELEEAVRWQFYELEAGEHRFAWRKADLPLEEGAAYVCAAVPRAFLEEFCSARSGLFTALDLRPFALWRGFRLARAGASPCVVVASWPDGVTVVGGRAGAEFVREIPPAANVASEVARTVDYYRRAFDAAGAEVAELGGEDAARATADGCAFAVRDPAFADLLPEAHRRVRPAEFRRPRAAEAAAAVCLCALLVSAVPHVLAWRYRGLEGEVRAGVVRSASAAAEALAAASEAAKYREWTGAVRTHRVVSYAAVLADLRAATPPGAVLDEVEIGGEAAPGSDGQAAQQGKPAQPRAGAPGTAQARPAQKTSAEQQSAGKAQLPALYTPDLLRVRGKARDLAEVGLLADNLAQLPYVAGVAVQEASYENGFYRFKLEAGLKW